MLYGILVVSRPDEDTAHITQRAAMLAAASTNATLELFSVVAPTGARRLMSWLRGREPQAERDAQQNAMRRLGCQSACLREHYGIRCTVASGVGALAEQVAARVAATAADMIVLGWQGEGWSACGGDARRIARQSARPVLVVRKQPRGPYARIAIPTDFSDAALRATETAMALLPAAQITFVHHYRAPGLGSMRSVGVGDDTIEQCRLRAQRQARAAYSAFLDRLSRTPAGCSLVLTGQPEALAMRSYVRNVKPDLVVLAAGAGGALQGWLADSTPSAVFMDTGCDVLLLDPRALAAPDCARAPPIADAII